MLLKFHEGAPGNDDASWEDATDALIGSCDLRLLMSTPGPHSPLSLPKRAKSLSPQHARRPVSCPSSPTRPHESSTHHNNSSSIPSRCP
jgi:hypothetical protein